VGDGEIIWQLSALHHDSLTWGRHVLRSVILEVVCTSKWRPQSQLSFLFTVLQ